jgi:hypothetical protein
MKTILFDTFSSHLNRPNIVCFSFWQCIKCKAAVRVPEGRHPIARGVNPLIVEGFTSLAKKCRPSGTGWSVLHLIHRLYFHFHFHLNFN